MVLSCTFEIKGTLTSEETVIFLLTVPRTHYVLSGPRLVRERYSLLFYSCFSHSGSFHLFKGVKINGAGLLDKGLGSWQSAG